MKIKVDGLEQDRHSPVFIAFSRKEPHSFRAHMAK
jgi:hypothetical protein